METDYFTPPEDTFYSGVDQTYAEAAASSVLYALNGALGQVQMSVMGAEQESEALDAFITHQLGSTFEEQDLARYAKRLELIRLLLFKNWI